MNIFAKINEALAERTTPPKHHTPMVQKSQGYSVALTAQTCAALKYGATQADVEAIGKHEPSRLSGVGLVIRCNHNAVKPEYLKRCSAAAAEVASGKPVKPTSRIAVADEFDSMRKIGRDAAMPAAAAQLEIVRRICTDLADLMGDKAGNLATGSGNALASLLTDDPDGVARVYREQAKLLRMFANKMKPTAFFNWRATLENFGIPVLK